MLGEEQMHERNAHLMNTVPGTRVLLSTTIGTPDMWMGTNTLNGYDGYSMYGYFEFKTPEGKGFAMSEDSPNWDFEVYNK